MTDDDTVTITIPREVAEWWSNRSDLLDNRRDVIAIIEACRAAVWTPQVGDMVQTRHGKGWLPEDPVYRRNHWRRVVVDVTDRHVVTRDTDDGAGLRAVCIEDVRPDERPEPSYGWLTAWWDEHRAEYLDGDQ